jgi:hypothetical protein
MHSAAADNRFPRRLRLKGQKNFNLLKRSGARATGGTLTVFFYPAGNRVWG